MRNARKPGKPIETKYKGRLYRSLTEARIAIFLDEIGARAVAEPYGVELPYSGSYLVDWEVDFPFYVFNWRRNENTSDGLETWQHELERKTIFLEGKYTLDVPRSERNKLRELCVLRKKTGAIITSTDLRGIVEAHLAYLNKKEDEDAYPTWRFREVHHPLSVYVPVDTEWEDHMPADKVQAVYDEMRDYVREHPITYDLHTGFYFKAALKALNFRPEERYASIPNTG